MELTKKQEEGLRIAVNRHRNMEKYTVIAGYAGTGKSTLVKFIIEALDVQKERVCYATFTGKAAQVLSQKGNKNAMTLHRLLFESKLLPDGSFLRTPKTSIEYDIVIVDLMLPTVDGFAICKRIREVKDIPILVVSAKKVSCPIFGVNPLTDLISAITLK